ncbi:MAG: hypothetical protein COX70_06725 [Flavobacteriales bacterium CG_4_10_14_0_2_um_filter_32_8]|nr:MAG: hypothetical protein COX70_06725 [Flavobacteriales bacterium CG_4_10_14_0_2_um_filter_32_8]PJB16089.1 MAG: hypothetical protein CO118_01125 [Flavobacteriales bacterium CG_4_9_14_3_um_filter_32_8]
MNRKVTIITFFLSIVLVLNGLTTIAQTNKLDSLQQELATEKDELKQIDILNQLFQEQYSTTSNYEKTLQYAQEALKKLKAIDNKDEKILKKISTSANNVGTSYLLLDEYEKSLEYLLMALQTAESIQDTNSMLNALYNLSTLFSYRGEDEKGNSYLEQAIHLSELSGNIKSAAFGYSSMASNYFFASNYNKAMVYYEKAMRFAKSLNDLNLMSNLYGNRAVGLVRLKRYEEALKYHELTIALDIQLENKEGLKTDYLNIADVYIKMKNNEKALEFNFKSLELALEQNSINSIMMAYSGLAESYQQMGNNAKALEYLQLYTNWKDTLYSQQNAEAIAEMQTKYDTEKKETENNLLKTQQALDKAEIDKKATQQYMLLLGLGLALIIVFYVVYSLNQKKKINKILNTQNEIIAEKNKDITDSINYAQRLQGAILPEMSILNKHYESFIYYQPKDIVSGDFYWLKEMGDKIYFSVVDCTGHGVPGAFMSIIGYNSLNRIVEDFNVVKPGDILDELNIQVNKVLGTQENKGLTIRDGMDISICCINRETKILEYAGANNSLYLLRKSQNESLDLETTMEEYGICFYEIKSNKMPIGGGDNTKNYQTHTIKLNKEDTIYLFSDGFADQFGGPKGKKFMYKNFKKLLLSIQKNSIENQLKELDKTMVKWKGELSQLDDICVMGVKIS